MSEHENRFDPPITREPNSAAWPPPKIEPRPEPPNKWAQAAAAPLLLVGFLAVQILPFAVAIVIAVLLLRSCS